MIGLALIPGNIVGALVATKKGTARNAIAIGFGIIGVSGTALLSDLPPILRTVLAFGVAGAFLRLIEIVRFPDRAGTLGRVVATALPFIDVHRTKMGPRSFHFGKLFTGAVELAIAWELCVRAGTYAPVAPYANWPRTILGAASVYFLVDATARILYFACHAIGARVDLPHDAPILSKSIAEFWGKRWNRVVAAWLNENAFRPAASRFGVVFGIFFTFFVSGLVHFIPIALTRGWIEAVWMGSFFLVHGVLVIVEAKLGLRRLRPALGWTITFASFVATSPLFVEPMLRAVGF